jgi:hypothetical protein
VISPEQQKDNQRRARERSNGMILRDLGKDSPVKVRTKTPTTGGEPAKVIPLRKKEEPA